MAEFQNSHFALGNTAMGMAGDSKPKPRISRRDFFKLLKIIGPEILLLISGGIWYASTIEPAWVEVTKLNLKLPHLPKSFGSFKLVQISDLHVGGWLTKARLLDALKVVEAQTPDLILITGDFVLMDDQVSKSYIEGELDMLARVLPTLTRRFPTIGVMGNHDVRWGTQAVLQITRQAGVVDLINEIYTLQRGNKSLYIAGVDDVQEGRPLLDDVVAQLPIDGCAIMLAHEPDYADASLATGRFDLQLSGHSHGGQVVLPLIGPPILPRLGRKYPSGLYQVGGMYLYTNRGLGMIPPNIRLNCRPEITVFTLESI